MTVNFCVLDDIDVCAGAGSFAALVKERPADLVIKVFLGGVFVGADALQQIGVGFVFGELAQLDLAGAGLVVDIALVDQSLLLEVRPVYCRKLPVGTWPPWKMGPVMMSS